MTNRRWIAASLLCVVMIATLGPVIGTAAYLRSDAYRGTCVETLSRALSLPCEIGGVTPRSRSAREFRDITVYLPSQRDRAMSCRRAIVRRTPAPNSPDDYEIDLFGGAAEISTRTWLRDDYRGVLESGLRPGFSRDGPRRVNFADMVVRLQRDSFNIVLSGAGGRVDFGDHKRGSAAMIARMFNGFPCPEPVRLTAEFSPEATGVRVDKLELTTPDLPLAITRLRDLVGIHVEKGAFSGRLLYGESDAGRWLAVSGRVSGLELAELSRGLTPTPWHGRLPNLELLELRAENRVPKRLHFRGRVEEMVPGDWLALAGINGVDGVLRLDIGDADFSANGIDRLIASGEISGLSLTALSRGLKRGEMTGELRAKITDLTIVDNHIESLEAEFHVADASDEPNWIEGSLLRELAREFFKVNFPPLLPQRIPYSKLGLRISVRDERLTVFGSHGDENRTILTLRLFGNDVPAVFEPSHAIDLRVPLDVLRKQIATQLRTAWEEREAARRAASQPQEETTQPADADELPQ